MFNLFQVLGFLKAVLSKSTSKVYTQQVKKIDNYFYWTDGYAIVRYMTDTDFYSRTVFDKNGNEVSSQYPDPVRFFSDSAMTQLSADSANMLLATTTKDKNLCLDITTNKLNYEGKGVSLKLIGDTLKLLPKNVRPLSVHYNKDYILIKADSCDVVIATVVSA